MNIHLKLSSFLRRKMLFKPINYLNSFRCSNADYYAPFLCCLYANTTPFYISNLSLLVAYMQTRRRNIRVFTNLNISRLCELS